MHIYHIYQHTDVIECNKHELDDTLMNCVKLFVILYTDDTLILAESANDIQEARDVYELYCISWKLVLHIAKC